MAEAARRSRFGQGFDRLDVVITTSLARVGVPVLRIGLGLVFLWFGALKFFPDLSPAQDLATRTISQLTLGAVGPDISLPILATWESLIGLGLLSKRFLRTTLLLLAVQMVGTVMPLVLFPAETFTRLPPDPVDSTAEHQPIASIAIRSHPLRPGVAIGNGQRGARLSIARCVRCGDAFILGCRLTELRAILILPRRRFGGTVGGIWRQRHGRRPLGRGRVRGRNRPYRSPSARDPRTPGGLVRRPAPAARRRCRLAAFHEALAGTARCEGARVAALTLRTTQQHLLGAWRGDA
jgi:uncharacterized membrane protein YphA (DoxX/SURF4 family)